MSFMIESRSANEIYNKDREHFISLEMKEDYSFKYVPENHFKHIVKNVQRHRRKEDEERIWTSFVKEQELNNFRYEKLDNDCSIQNLKDLLQENMQDVDRELKRLEEDALPERSKGIQNNKSDVKNGMIYPKTNNVGNNSFKNKKELTKDKSVHNISAKTSNKESEGLKIVFRSKAKPSLSDSSLTEKKSYTNQLLRATNFENNSDSYSSNDRDDIVYVQPDPFTIEKLLTMQKKIAELLDEISFKLCRIPLPDGDHDLKRRQQQMLEFAIRFSRNYLYDLNRLITSIERHVRVVSSRTGLKRYHRNIVFHQDMITQKLVAAHQLSIQALNAYSKHIPISVLEGHSTKLQDILQIVCNLANICDKVEVSTNYFCSGDTAAVPLGKSLQDKRDAILSQLKLNLEGKRGATNCKEIESAVTIPSKGHSNRKNLSSRLSMYSMDVNTKVSKNNPKRRIDLRRKSRTCQKEKEDNVKKIKSVHTQHYSLPELLYPSPITSSARNVEQIGTLKDTNYSKEDEIRTMMDGLTIDSENGSNVEIHTRRKAATNNNEQQSAIIRKKTSEVWRSKSTENRQKNSKVKEDDLAKNVTITKEDLATLAPMINDLIKDLMLKKYNELEPVSETSVETLRELLQKYQSPKDSDTKESLTEDNYEQSHCKSNDRVFETQKHGENMQLICISSMEKVPKTTRRDVSYQADYEIMDDGKVVDSNCKNGIELVISKRTELQFLAYKSEYKKLCQLKPMYSSNTQNKPWDIVAWISDKLIEEIITEITEELQMDNIIEKLYDMEFREF